MIYIDSRDFPANRRRLWVSDISYIQTDDIDDLDEGILFLGVNSFIVRKATGQEMIQSAIGWTRAMTIGERTASFLEERFRVLSRTDLQEERDITDDNASFLLFVSSSTRLGIVPMSLSGVVHNTEKIVRISREE
ncbi:hypothetical protein DMN91_000988 [Ooceraea biroi]|uniref:Uncharacterized protein n=1 Tax=Ooceraea biroi TaxID=2015173 RepID=A0A3L8E5S2_OOCBI|nr:hypothetical protein DMN91_000988 [Ooceraea biroi]